jgi:hypothetical protein
VVVSDLIFHVFFTPECIYIFFWLIGWNVQSNSFIEGVAQKIRRQIEELQRVSGVESNALTVDGVPVDSYLTRSVY